MSSRSMHSLNTSKQDRTAVCLISCAFGLEKLATWPSTCWQLNPNFDRYGSAERGRTVFEGLVGNLPKRVDLWGIYLDMEARLVRQQSETSKPDLSKVRMLFERCCTLDLSTKKMKYFFKRYLEFEKEFGTDDRVEAVKEKAREYVESKTQ
mmetsp:Transcript_5676/g.16878  ORF Transcript_5676/g.16878 Transcript_5676/m.16878 type:complete len:151 (+) Transcript_5676:5446-5898(+)